MAMMRYVVSEVGCYADLVVLALLASRVRGL